MTETPVVTAGAEVPTKPDFAQARTALILVVFLQIALEEGLQAGSGVVARWFVPAVEIVLLLVLSSLTSWRIHRLERGHVTRLCASQRF